MISAIILTKNEEKNIKECISCLAFCDEVLVIDDYSQDKTVKIAKSCGAKIIKRHLQGDFAAQRNFGLENAKCDWILFVDADERITKELANEIAQKTKQPICSAYFINRFDVFVGEKLKGGEAKQQIIRLARRDAGKWKRSVHETWHVTGVVKLLDAPLFHYAHESISDFVDDIGNYSSMHTKEHLKEGKDAKFSNIILFPIAKFVISFFVRSGYKDRERGFIYSVMMSFHSFLSWSELWLLKNKK